jgi:hypothetical protein
MKPIFFILVLTTLFMSCSQPNNNKANVALIESYVQAVENLDYEAIEGVLDDNYVGLGPSFGDSIRKPEVIETMKVNFEFLYESIDYEKSRSIAVDIVEGDEQGEWVSNWAELTITYKEDQNRVRLWTNSVYKIENGKIVKSFTFYNEADALEQLGYVFINPNDL